MVDRTREMGLNLEARENLCEKIRTKLMELGERFKKVNLLMFG